MSAVVNGPFIDEKLCRAYHAAIDIRLTAMEEALKLRTNELDRRFSGLSDLHDRLTAVETRATTWTVALGLFFAIVQVALHFIK